MNSRKLIAALCFVLPALVVFCYWPVHSFDFVYLDDDVYVIENPLVRGGLGWDNVKAAFASFRGGIWMPLTTLSFVLDYELHGMDAGGFHVTNLVLHCLNTLLLFCVLMLVTGAPWRSFFVAAVFGVHPLHVESVAWVTERKDVLSGLFFMLCLWSYTWYVDRPAVGRYVLLIVLFVLGLAAKPMLVTLPALLMLLDWWPLGRFGKLSGTAIKTIGEKIPLFGIAAAACVVSYYAQQHGNAVTGFDRLSLSARLANAVLSYAFYVRDAFFPAGLAVLYPHPGEAVAMLPAAVAASGLAALTAALMWYRRSVPAVLTGWLWYLGMLVPVIGMVQIGPHARADRFTYLPLIGIAVAVAWGLPRLFGRLPRKGAVLSVVSAFALLGCVTVTRQQVQRWQSSITLFEHTLAVTLDNCLMHNNLGHAYARAGRGPEAREQFRLAAQLCPDYAAARYNYGMALEQQRRYRDAVGELKAAVALEPDNALFHNKLGSVFFQLQDYDAALTHFERAVQLEPDFVGAANNYGALLIKVGAYEKALAFYQGMLDRRPDYAKAHFNKGSVLAALGRYQAAADAFQQAIALKHDYAKAYAGLGKILLLQGRAGQAVPFFRKALSLRPDYAAARRQLRAAEDTAAEQ